MCGFLGQYNCELTSKEYFLSLLSISLHRGPDQTGYWSDERLQLGFNRLAIVDLSDTGNQPMTTDLSSWVLMFNGEIYNHLELRKQFLGYKFKGHSDTETILASLEAIGFLQTIKSLVGMFAIVAYHKPSRVLYAARDSVGIKPFFYNNDPKNFFFGSQFDQIVQAIGKQHVKIKPEGMRDFLQFGYMQAPNTIYQEIKQLDPGEIAEIDGEKILLNRFCEYPQNVEDSGLHENSDGALEKFNKLFQKVCQDQLQSDVSTATFLSSGIDSTLVTAFANKSKSNLTAYTIGFGGAQGDERTLASEYAKHLNINHVSQDIVEEELLKSLDDHFQKLGEPFADFSSIPTYLICQRASEQNKVMLSGDGGDELFWGYQRMHNSIINYPFYKDSLIMRKIKRKLRIFAKPIGGAIYDFSKPNIAWENAHSHIPLKFFERLMPGINKSNETSRLYQFGYKDQKNFRSWIRYNEFYAHMQRVLIKVDRMSMAHSMEVRVPLLDQRIVDFAWNLDSNFGISKKIELKKFLKLVLKQHIPKEMMNRQKMGFYIPIGVWLRTSLKAEVQDLLLKRPIYGEEYIDRLVWNDLVADFYNGKGSVSEWGIWIMYCWQKWGLSMEE